MCSRVPLPPYIKEKGGGQPALIGRAPSTIPTRNPIPSRFTTREERGKEGEGGEKERGAGPLALVQFGLG